MIRFRIIEEEAEVPRTLDQFKNWTFSSSSVAQEDFLTFAKLFRNYIKHNLPPGAELVTFNRGHYYCSGFIRRGENYVYFSISDVRHFPRAWHQNILIRTAENEKDYKGGVNYYTSLKEFRENVTELLDRGKIPYEKSRAAMFNGYRL